MSKIIKKITLDVTNPNTIRAVRSKQNDTDSRFLSVTLTDEGEVIHIPSSAEVVMSAERSDGSRALLHGTVGEYGSVTLPLTGWISETEGCTRCDVSVYDSGEKLTAMTFIIETEGSINADSEITESEDLDEITALMSELQSIREAEEVRVVAENSRISRENERYSSEIARISAEEARETAEAGRVRAESERNAAEAMRTAYVPAVSPDGVLSWSNDKGLPNPAPTRIKGDTPVRGIDYWTESDIASIRSYIDEKILGGEW